MNYKSALSIQISDLTPQHLFHNHLLLQIIKIYNNLIRNKKLAIQVVHWD